jgi:hypothetical protein
LGAETAMYPFNIPTKKKEGKNATKNKNNTFKIELANKPKFCLSTCIIS